MRWIAAICAALLACGVLANAQDLLRNDLTAREALAAQKDGRIKSLAEIRRGVRRQIAVVEFLNARLIAAPDGEPDVYCVRVLAAPNDRLDLQVDPVSGEIQVDPRSGEVLPEWLEQGVTTNRCAFLAVEDPYASPSG